jgi:hypothetical protein
LSSAAIQMRHSRQLASATPERHQPTPGAPPAPGRIARVRSAHDAMQPPRGLGAPPGHAPQPPRCASLRPGPAPLTAAATPCAPDPNSLSLSQIPQPSNRRDETRRTSARSPERSRAGGRAGRDLEIAAADANWKPGVSKHRSEAASPTVRLPCSVPGGHGSSGSAPIQVRPAFTDALLALPGRAPGQPT